MNRAEPNHAERIVLCAAGVRLISVWLIADGLINLGHALLLHFIASSVIQFPLYTLKGLFERDMIEYVWSSFAINIFFAALLWFNSRRIAKLLLSKI